MDNIRKRFLDSTTARSGPNNALANTILADDEPPSSAAAKDAEPTGPPAKPPPEQRIQLAQALLSLGDISAAQYFLAKYPWIAQSHPDIADLILRLIANALEDLFKAEVTGLEQVEGDSDIDMSASTSTKEVVPTLYAPSPPETATKVFQFFYPGWREGAEKWTSPADIHEKGMRWFSLVRGMGGRAGSVMAKICRIATKHFAQLKEQKIREAGLSASSTVKDVIRQSEVCPFSLLLGIHAYSYSPLRPKWSLGSMSFESSYFPHCPTRT
jgi:THO complex subunit 2